MRLFFGWFMGPAVYAPAPGGGGHASSLLMEDGSYLLLETGDTILTE